MSVRHLTVAPSAARLTNSLRDIGYDFPSAVADRPSRCVDPAGQRRVGYDPSSPDRGNEIILADDPIVVLDQVNQKIEHLLLYRNRCRAVA